MRGDKNYSARTHKVADKGSDAKQKEVWDMIGAKKKLHDMVEALINGDSKAAAASLHDYLQVKTRSILGEMDDEMDTEMVADHQDEEEGEPCEHCGGEGCEHCEDHDDFDFSDEGDDENDEFGDDFGSDDFDADDTDEDDLTFEGDRGNAVADDASVRTRMVKNSMGSKDLESRVHGNIDFGSSARSGSKSSDSGAPKKTHMVKNSMGAEDLESKVDGDLDFEDPSRSGTHSSDSGAPKKTTMHKNSEGAAGLQGKVSGKIKF
jgi:hypothetical protein